MSDFCAKHGTPISYTLFTCGCKDTNQIKLSLKMYEAAVLMRAMGEARGHVLNAGKLLGISRSTMYRKLVQNPYMQKNWFIR